MIDKMIEGFEPIFDENSKVLILGSFPSVKSRQEGFYYGNKRNRFWQTLADIFCVPLPVTTEQKIKMLIEHNIALWDIVNMADIKGSADSDIKNFKVVDLKRIFDNCQISFVICNGKKSWQILSSNYDLTQKVFVLPSTSPANV
jgi:hypoxanthine-DNA glycosylase